MQVTRISRYHREQKERNQRAKDLVVMRLLADGLFDIIVAANSERLLAHAHVLLKKCEALQRDETLKISVPYRGEDDFEVHP